MAKWHYEGTRDVPLYPFLWVASAKAAAEAEKDPDPRHFCLASIMCAAFCLEAFLNYAIERKFKDRKGLEPLQPRAKLDLLLDVAKCRVDMGTRPFQSFCSIFSFRNDWAHPKPFSWKHEGVVEIDAELGLHGVEPPPAPEREWERMLNVKTAKCFVEDTMRMIDVLSRKVLKEKVANWAEESTLYGMTLVSDS